MNRMTEAIDELIEDMRDMVGERDTLGRSDYLEEWLEDLVFLGEQAANLLREISDPDSIPSIRDVVK